MLTSNSAALVTQRSKRLPGHWKGTMIAAMARIGRSLVRVAFVVGVFLAGCSSGSASKVDASHDTTAADVASGDGGAAGGKGGQSGTGGISGSGGSGFGGSIPVGSGGSGSGGSIAGAAGVAERVDR